MMQKIPRWESDLWQYLSTGDGKHCPLYENCRIRAKGKWCLDDGRESMDWLIEDTVFCNSSFDFIGSGTCYGEFKTVEMLAEKLLREGKIDCPPVPTELIQRADREHPIDIRLVPLKACHGAVWRLGDEWVVQLNENDRPATRRFALFHEGFHILAHCKTEPVFRKRGTELGTFNEVLADFFAACVLMPKEWVKAKWAEVHDLNQMVRIFNVPKSAMCLRLKRLGLI